MALTDIRIRSLQPGRHHDGRGIGLMIYIRPTSKGGLSRTWVQRLRLAGGTRDIGLGAYPGVSLAEARLRAAENKRLLEQGIDPVAARREARRAAFAKGEEVKTLREAVNAHLEAQAPGWKGTKTEKLFRSSLERHAAKLLQQSVDTITKEEVRAALSKVWTAKPATASAIRGRLERVLEFAIAAGWRGGPNPAVWRGGLRPLLAAPAAIHRTVHRPALDWQRVPAFLAALAEHGRQTNAAKALRLCILTGVRSGEARGATAAEFDLESRLWTIPGSRMKEGIPHRVPLSEPVLKLVRDAVTAADDALPCRSSRFQQVDQDRAGAGRLLFPSPRGVAYSDTALLQQIIRMQQRAVRYGTSGWVTDVGARISVHGFRASFRSWAADHGYARELAEAALAHVTGNAVERAYQRSDLLTKRAAMMQAWAEFCTSSPGAS